MSGIEIALSVAQTLIAALECSALRGASSSWNFESDLRGLQRTVITVKKVLLDAGNKKELLGDEQFNYIQQLKDAVYDADDLFDKFLTLAERKQNRDHSDKVLDFFSSQNPLGIAYSTSRDVKKIRNQLNEIADDHTRFGFNVNATQSPVERKKVVETYSHVLAGDVIGREDDTKEVVNKLLYSTDDIGFLSIVGMGGLGKTTLTKLVFRDERIKQEFPLRIWACVSDQDGVPLDVKNILSNMLESVHEKPEKGSSFQYVQNEYVHQFQRNLKGEKFLLILDDVWTEEPSEWGILKGFLRLGGKGSRIIATTRSRQTAEIIGKDTHELKGLSKDNSWRLFEMTAFRNEPKPSDLVNIGKKIVQKCSNVPLAIQVVGRLLYKQPIGEWKAIQTRGLAGISDAKNEIMPILKLSYDCLEPSVKTCFAYCALFPKDYVIKKDLLINLWEAQGYIVPDHAGGKSNEEVGEEHFAILLQRYFFQDVKENEYGEVDSFKMHNLMHDLAQKVSGKEVCILNTSISNVEYCTRHLFGGRYIKDDSFIIPNKSRSYLMFQKRWFFDYKPDLPTTLVVKLTENLGCLRALALQGLRARSLPDTMGNLLHLRYLNLAKNSMKKLPDSIAKLHNLQTLNLNRCDELKEWPKEFSKLVNLTHLYREHCYELRCMPVGMSKLTRLRVLTDFVVEDESAVGMQNVGQLEDLKAFAANLKGHLLLQFHVNFTSSEKYDWEGSCLDGSEHLKKLHIHFSFPSPVLSQRRNYEKRRLNEEGVMDRLQPHPNLWKLELSNYAGDVITRWGRAQDDWATFLPKLVHIKLSDCHRLQQLPLLCKLLHLKSLYLSELKSLKYVEEALTSGSCSGSSDTTFFPSLESLEMHVLKNLKGWWSPSDTRMSNHQLAFPRLSQLTIENCPHLVSFPSCSSHPKIDLRNNNEALEITTADEVHDLHIMLSE